MGTVGVASAQEDCGNENAAEQADNCEQAQTKAAAQGPKQSPPGLAKAEENWKKHVKNKVERDFPPKPGGDDGGGGDDGDNGGIII